MYDDPLAIDRGPPDHNDPLGDLCPETPIVASRVESHLHERARAIMGRNFLGLPEATALFGRVSRIDRRDLDDIPFSTRLLERCARTHVLIADTGINVNSMRMRRWALRMRACLEHEVFADHLEPATWRLVRRHPRPGFFGKSLNEQRPLLRGTRETLLSARQTVYAVLLYEHARRYKLLGDMYAGTTDFARDGQQIVVGPFTQHRLCLDPWPHGDRHIHMAAMTERRPDMPRLVWM